MLDHVPAMDRWCDDNDDSWTDLGSVDLYRGWELYLGSVDCAWLAHPGSEQELYRSGTDYLIGARIA